MNRRHDHRTTCIILGILLFVSLEAAGAQIAPDIGGAWLLQCKLVAAPDGGIQPGQPGSVFEKQVRIECAGSQGRLVTQEGGVYSGRYYPTAPDFPNGVWYFSLSIQLAPRMISMTEIVVQHRTASTVQGGYTTTYAAQDYLTGQPVPIGKEVVMFEGLRVQ